MTEETRSIVQQVAIAAPAEAVWRALTDAEELKRWFPVDARVEPGVGGKVWISWGPGSEGESRIEIWEPGRHLRTSVQVEGMAVPFAIDYHIDAQGGTTVLRLVVSGFGAGADWDNMYHGMDAGWHYFLFNLRHYLERHRGVPRGLAWERRPITRSRDEVRGALLTALGLPADARPLQGDGIRMQMDGETVEGAVVLALPDHLAAELPALDDALLFVELEPGGEQQQVGVYLSTYGLAADRVAALQAGVGRFLDDVIPKERND